MAPTPAWNSSTRSPLALTGTSTSTRRARICSAGSTGAMSPQLRTRAHSSSARSAPNAATSNVGSTRSPPAERGVDGGMTASGGGGAHGVAVDVGEHIATGVDVVVLDSVGHHRPVAPERHRDLVGRVAHEVEHDLDDLGVGELAADTRHEGVVDP